MRAALLAIVLLTGCNSTVDVTPGRPCATSLGCDEGERCDDGTCTPDVGCPPALSPKLLFSTPPDLGGIQVIDGHEYRPTKSGSSDAPTTTTVFTDLVDGTTLTFEHASGGASCGEQPAWCDVLSQGIETVFANVTFDRAKGKITAAASAAVPEGYTVLDPGDLPASVLLHNDVAVTRFDVATQAQETIVEMGDVDAIMGMPRRTPAGERKLVGIRKDAASWTLLEAPVAPNAAWTPFFTADDGATSVIPAPDGWFVLAPSSGGIAVWRTGPTGSALLSTFNPTESSDAIRDLSGRYALGDRLLDDGSRGRAVGCGELTCASEEIDLATAERRTLGFVTIPQAQSFAVAGERWLACDTVEVVLQDLANSNASSPTGGDTRFYLARILPSAQ